jgi:hypothetical protein
MNSGVAIATPAYGGMVTSAFTKALLGTFGELTARGIAHGWMTADGAMVGANRNTLAATVLSWPWASHVLFIDADMGWTPADALRLLAADKDVLGGVGRVKRPFEDPPTYAYRPMTDAHGSVLPPALCPRTGLLEVEAIGTAFLCIKRRVFERLAAAYPESKYDADERLAPDALQYLHDFFPVAVVGRRLEGEDFGFCQRWRAIGGRIWLDPSIQLAHHGMASWDGDPMSSLFVPA